MVSAQETLSMQVNLFVSGRKLRDLDTFSKSDPQCMIYEKVNGNWVKKGQTEQLNNNLNPDFRISLTMAYWFEKKQEIRFVFIDGDGAGDYDTIGSIEVTMGQLMGARAQTFKGNLSHQGKANCGEIIVRTEAIQESNECMSYRVRVQRANN